MRHDLEERLARGLCGLPCACPEIERQAAISRINNVEINLLNLIICITNCCLLRFNPAHCITFFDVLVGPVDFRLGSVFAHFGYFNGGFGVQVTTTEPIDSKTEWQGQLIRRDDTTVYLSQKGRTIQIPRELVSKVYLDDNG